MENIFLGVERIYMRDEGSCLNVRINDGKSVRGEREPIVDIAV